MSRHDPQVRLRHMLAYATEAVMLMRDRRRADLDVDRALGLAVLRCVEIVGEAASRIPVAIRRRHPNIPWAQIIAMRNRLIHGYDIVDYDIVWSTVSQDLPPLIAEFIADHAARSEEHLNGVSKGGEHPLWSRAGINTPPAKWLRLFGQDTIAEVVARKNVREAQHIPSPRSHKVTG